MLFQSDLLHFLLKVLKIFGLKEKFLPPGLNRGGGGKTLQQGEETEQLLLGKGCFIENMSLVFRKKKSESDIKSDFKT